MILNVIGFVVFLFFCRCKSFARTFGKIFRILVPHGETLSKFLRNSERVEQFEEHYAAQHEILRRMSIVGASKDGLRLYICI